MAINATDVIVEGYAPGTFQPSVLSATAFNTGNAGKLEINTSSLLVREGGRIDSSAFASGDSGSIIINASKSIDISATPNSLNPSLVISSANIESQTLRNLFRLPPIPSGSSGDINVNTPILNITGNALVTVRNEGSGNAGNININANRINISNGGGISATTAIAEGGNIGIESKLVQLNNGNISSTAGKQGSNGNGGNISIDTDILLGVNNSRITANAFLGRGGNITINTQGLFFSSNTLLEASSQQGINGDVEINISRTQPEPSKANLEVITQNPEISSVCQGRSVGDRTPNEFVMTGTSGIPQDFNNIPNSNLNWQDNSIPVALTSNLENSRLPSSQETAKITPAQGWQFNTDGTVTLTEKPNTISAETFLSNNSCSFQPSATQFRANSNKEG